MDQRPNNLLCHRQHLLPSHTAISEALSTQPLTFSPLFYPVHFSVLLALATLPPPPKTFLSSIRSIGPSEDFLVLGQLMAPLPLAREEAESR